MTPENVKNYGTGWAEFTQLLEAHYMVVMPWAVKHKTACAQVTESYWYLREPVHKVRCGDCQAILDQMEIS